MKLKSSAAGNSNPLADGVALQKALFEGRRDTPNQNDANSNLFAKMKEPIKGHNKGWAGLANALFTGLESGSQAASVRSKQESLGKFERVMEYFEGVNQEAIQRKDHFEKRNMAKSKYMPQLLAYSEKAMNMDPISRKSMAQTVLEGWNRDTGDDMRITTIDGSDPLLVTVVNKQGQSQLLDLRDMFAGDELMQNKLAMQMPEYQEKMKYERGLKERELQIKEGELKVQQDKITAESGALPPAQVEDLKRKLKEREENEAKLKTVDDLLGVFNGTTKVPKAGGEAWVPNFMGGTPTPRQAIINQGGKDLKLSEVNTSNTDDSSIGILKREKAKLEASIKESKGIEEKLGFKGTQQPQPQPSGGKIKIRTKEGTPGEVPEDQLDWFISQGAEVIQ